MINNKSFSLYLHTEMTLLYNTATPAPLPPVVTGVEKETSRAGGRRGQVKSLAHAYATCVVMSGLDKGP